VRFARVLAISIAVLLLFFATSAPGYATTPAHGCAQPTPPPVSGSPVTPPATPGIVVINEILNNPDSTWIVACRHIVVTHDASASPERRQAHIDA
jgi:hypothetical protein